MKNPLVIPRFRRAPSGEAQRVLPTEPTKIRPRCGSNRRTIRCGLAPLIAALCLGFGDRSVRAAIPPNRGPQLDSRSIDLGSVHRKKPHPKSPAQAEACHVEVQCTNDRSPYCYWTILLPEMPSGGERMYLQFAIGLGDYSDVHPNIVPQPVAPNSIVLVEDRLHDFRFRVRVENRWGSTAGQEMNPY